MKQVWLVLAITLAFVVVVPCSAEEETAIITLTPEQMETYRFQLKPSKVTVKDLTVGQQTILSSKRRAAKDLIQRQLGIVKISGTKDDLRALQQLVDRKVLRNSQVEEWQSMGVLFGDILAREFSLKWVSYKDERGVNKALRYRKSDNFIFPVTLFSKRVKFDEEIDMRDLYATLESQIREFIALENRFRLPNS
jgi:hypothetical protein